MGPGHRRDHPQGPAALAGPEGRAGSRPTSGAPGTPSPPTASSWCSAATSTSRAGPPAGRAWTRSTRSIRSRRSGRAAGHAHGRWYPTGVRMADGRIPITSGLDETGTNKMDEDMETFTPAAALGGTRLDQPDRQHQRDRLVTAPDRRLLPAHVRDALGPRVRRRAAAAADLVPESDRRPADWSEARRRRTEQAPYLGHGACRFPAAPAAPPDHDARRQHLRGDASLQRDHRGLRRGPARARMADRP